MGALFGSNDAPQAPPPVTAPPPPAPTYQAQVSNTARPDGKVASNAGFQGTIITSPQGLKDQASTAQKTLMGN